MAVFHCALESACKCDGVAWMGGCRFALKLKAAHCV